MKSIRFLTAAAVLVLLPALMFAGSVSAVGYGDTRSEAQASARENLAARFMTRVESSRYMSVIDLDGRGYEQNLASQSTQNVSMDLVGVTLSEPQRTQDGKWQVEAVLSEDSLTYYIDRVNQLADEINRLYSANGSLVDYASVPYEVFSQLSTLVDSYSAYRNVVMMLSPSELSSLKTAAVTQSQISAQVDAKLNAEENDLEKELGAYKYRQELIGQLAAEDQQKMDELQARLDEMHQSAASRQDAMREEHQRTIDEIKSRFDTVSSFDYGDYYDDAVSGSDSFLTEAVNQLEIQKDGYSVLVEALSNALCDIYDNMETEAAEYRNAQMDMPYYGLELGEDGKPTDEAVSRRSGIVDTYIDDEIRPDYIRAAERVTEDYAGQLAKVQSNVLDSIEELNEKKLTYNSFQDEVSVAITGYDERTMEFVGYANLAVGSQTVRFDISFSYDDWTGEKANPDPQTIEEYYEYQQYAASAAVWSGELMENSALFMLEVDFYVEAYTDSPVYSVFVDSYDITRLDTGENVVRGKDVGMRYESTGRSSEPGFSYAPTDRKARNMASYFDYDGIIEKERSRDKISEKWAIYSYETESSGNINRSAAEKKRASASSLVFDNQVLFGMNVVMRPEFSDQVEDNAPMMTFGATVLDLLHMGPNGKRYGALLGAGADAGPVADGESDFFSDFDVSVRAGLGGYLLLSGNSQIALLASAVANYLFVANSFSAGAEGQLLYISDDIGMNFGFGLTFRYDFYRYRPVTDFPWTFGFVFGFVMK